MATVQTNGRGRGGGGGGIDEEEDSWYDIVSSTHAYTDELFAPGGMTHVLLHARRDARIPDRGVIGILPSVSANEAHFTPPPPFSLSQQQGQQQGQGRGTPVIQQYRREHAATLAAHVRRWREAAADQGSPPVLVGTVSFGKTNGHNHYCALWIDVAAGTCDIWDSATSAELAPRSEFSDLFMAATCELVGPAPRGCGWVADCRRNVRHIPATHYGAIFQRDGGYVPTRGSLEYQNIFCHTWTLFFIEFRMRGYSPDEISCLRGKDPRIPLLIIKLYAAALLLRRLHVPHPEDAAAAADADGAGTAEDLLQPRHRGLMYIWDADAHAKVHLGTFLADADARDPLGAVAYPDGGGDGGGDGEGGNDGGNGGNGKEGNDGEEGSPSSSSSAYPGCAVCVGAVVTRSKIWKPPCEIEAICARLTHDLLDLTPSSSSSSSLHPVSHRQ